MLDTHDLILNLQEVGFDERQSKVIVDVLKQTNADWVTKDYLRTEMSGLYVKIILLQVAIAGLLFAALKLF